MGSFGERLQREREMRGITLEEIADSTKIGTRSLRALEREDFDKLPGGIFNKGFVRAYARYLGIDEEQAVADFLAAAGDPEQPLPTPFPKARPASSSGGRSWAALLALAALAGGGFAAWKFKAGPFAGRVSQPQPVSAPPVVAPTTTTTIAPVASEQAASPAPASGTGSDSAAASPAVNEGFVVLVRAKEDSWVSIIADDRPVMEGTLLAAETREVRASKKVVLKLGNAAGVEVSYNHQVIALPGGANPVKTVVITPQGLQP